MIKADYDAECNAVSIVFQGDVDSAQAKRAYLDLEAILPKVKKGFALLTDFSSVDALEPEVQGEVKKAMDLLNAHGVAKVLRVLHDPDLDIGFNIMSSSHYSKQVQTRVFRSREEARSFLRREKGAGVYSDP